MQGREWSGGVVGTVPEESLIHHMLVPPTSVLRCRAYARMGADVWNEGCDDRHIDGILEWGTQGR